MKVKKSEKNLLPKYPSGRQFAESRALTGLATLGLTAMTGLADPASKGDAPIRKPGEMAVVPIRSNSEATNNPTAKKMPEDPARLRGRILPEPRPRLLGVMPPPKPVTTNHQGHLSYFVKQGDTLSGLAKEFLGDGNRWKEITAINPGLTAETLKADCIIMIPVKKSDASGTKE